MKQDSIKWEGRSVSSQWWNEESSFFNINEETVLKQSRDRRTQSGNELGEHHSQGQPSLPEFSPLSDSLKMSTRKERPSGENK